MTAAGTNGGYAKCWVGNAVSDSQDAIGNLTFSCTHVRSMIHAVKNAAHKIKQPWKSTTLLFVAEQSNDS